MSNKTRRQASTVDENLAVELSDIRGKLTDLQDSLTKVLENQTKNNQEVLAKVCELQKVNDEQKKKILLLEARIDDLE